MNTARLSVQEEELMWRTLDALKVYGLEREKCEEVIKEYYLQGRAKGFKEAVKEFKKNNF
jgi:hypothetical protein